MFVQFRRSRVNARWNRALFVRAKICPCPYKFQTITRFKFHKQRKSIGRFYHVFQGYSNKNVYFQVSTLSKFICDTENFFMKNAGFEFQPGKAMCLYTFERNLSHAISIGLVYHDRNTLNSNLKNRLRQCVLLSVAIKPSFLAPKQPASTPSERGRSKIEQDFGSSNGRFYVMLASCWCNGLHRHRTRETHFFATGLLYKRVLDLC